MLGRAFQRGTDIAQDLMHNKLDAFGHKGLLLIIIAFFLTANSAAAQPPKVSLIYPDAGINTQTVIAHLYGANFQVDPISMVRLVRSGYPDIDGDSINVVSDEYLTCFFDLTGNSAGLCNLLVSNNLGEDTLPGCFTICEPSDSPHLWVETTVYSGGPSFGGLAVGDADNDGDIEVYHASGSVIYQNKWDGTTWNQAFVALLEWAALDVALADGNGDCKLELYAACYDDTVYQFKWDGIIWQKANVGVCDGSVRALVLGDGNRDGDLEVYASDPDSIYQFKWNGVDWSRTTVGACFLSSIYLRGNLVAGDGNGDGELELYGISADSIGTSIYQFKWDGGSWARTTVAVDVGLALAVGDGDRDGDMELYAACSTGVSQLKWNGISWSRASVGSLCCAANRLTVGDGDGDGMMEVYGTVGTGLGYPPSDMGIHQFKWNGAQWVSAQVYKGEAYVPTIGDGNSDGGMEIYCFGGDHDVLQFKPAFIPDIELSHTEYDFGLVQVGDSLDWQYLIIKNRGVDTLSVDSLLSDTADYVVVAPSFPNIVLPDDSTLVTVRFMPFVLDTISGMLRVYSNDPDEAVLNVSLTGIGTDSTPPVPFSLISPPDSAMLVVTRPTFVWGASSDTLEGLKDYHVYVDFALRDSTVDTSWTADYDLAEGWHDWYIVANDSVGNRRQSSETWELLIDTTAPSVVTLISPPDSSYLSDTTVDFTWLQSTDDLSGVDHYVLQHTPDSGFSFGVIETILVDTTFTGIFADSAYYWHVRSVDAAGNEGDWSPARGFLVDTISPTEPILVNPIDGMMTNDSSVTFIWNASSDTQSGIDYYILQYADNPSFAGAVEIGTPDTTCTRVLTDTIYYWKVRALDKATNESGWSIVWNFTIDTGMPDVPILISPINGIYLGDTVVTFEWGEVTALMLSIGHGRADGKEISPLILGSTIRYVFQIDTLLDFVSPLFVDTLDTTSTTVLFYENFPFLWRVKAYDLAGNDGAYSAPDSFGIDITAPVIESTTVLVDTSYSGPFEVLTKATDNLSGIDSVLLCYRRDEDPDWVSVVMRPAGPPDWYVDSIPAVSNPNDTVRYYVRAFDVAQPPNSSTDPEGAPSKYHVFIGNFTGIEEARKIHGSFSFSLRSNPARNRVSFHFAIPEPAEVTLRIYDASGRLVDTPISGRKVAGIYDVIWDSDASSGVYFYRLESSWEKKTGKLVLIR